MLNIKDKNIRLKLIKNLSWPEVFAIWRQNEAYNGSHWHAHYKSRGFKTWEAWRLSYVQPFGLAKLNWQLFTIIEPQKTVPLFCGGPFRSWVEKYYQGQVQPTFAELAKNPQIKNHLGILDFMKNFPNQTTITGIILNGQITILEGMHRCCALALATNQGLNIDTKVKIALAQTNQTSLPVIGLRTKNKTE